MEQDCVNAGTIAKLCDKIQKLESERDALKAHIEELTAYEYREIGESGWMRCTKEWFEYCQKSPELDTRKRIKSLTERDAEQQKIGAASFKAELQESVKLPFRPHIEGVFQVWLGRIKDGE